jgi:hypothetical protein
VPFVQRRSGAVVGCYATLQPGIAEEFLSDDHPEVVAFQAPKPPIDLSNIDNLEKTLKAIGLLMRDYCNQLSAGTYTTKTVAHLKADFAAKYQAIP